MTEQAKTINIDGTEYKHKDLSQEQIILINKTSKWQAEANKLKDAFEDANLKTSLAKSAKK